MSFIHVRPLIELSVKSGSASDMIDITKLAEEKLWKAGVKAALVFVMVPHTTAGVCLNESADPAVRADVLKKLNTLIPRGEPLYTHGEGNSDAHVKTALTGNSVTLLFEKNRFLLGQWQGLYFCEFDGPRQRTVWLKVLDYGQEPLD
jgi:secondary thiamine-phosphate synthase enzyme